MNTSLLGRRQFLARTIAASAAAGLRLPIRPSCAAQPVKPQVTEAGWPGWRGLARDGQTAWLPEEFASELQFRWRRPMSSQGLAGVSVSGDRLIVVDRDLTDSQNIFRCLDASTGAEKWTYTQQARGRLDYGNSPRATPLIDHDLVFLLGAFGHLACVELATGHLVWSKNLRQEFSVRDTLIWGTCSSPLLVDGRLIVNPGAPQASLAALDPESGDVLWTSRGEPAAYASFIVAELGGKRQ
ncbi:MAG: hypothetical protein EHM42_05920, partial [Planctomycetaceae bacterium]